MTPYIAGIDVSEDQGVIDWAKVRAAGYRFAILKCGNGNDGIDPTFAKNLAAARAQGITLGAYQFLYPIGLLSIPGHTNRQPEEQAKYHFGASQGLGCGAGDIQVFMDAEWPESTSDWTKYNCSIAQIQDWLCKYKQTYEAESGCAVGLYTDEYWWEQIQGGTLTSFAASPFWAASPMPTATLPVAPYAPKLYKPFTSWSIWQHTWRLSVPGIADAVDGNCIPDENTFAALTTRP